MASIAPERNPSLYLLSDHLQAALARGEELLAEELALGAPDAAGLRPWLRQTRELAGFVASVRTLEYAMTARLLQARKRAEDLKRSDSRLKPLIVLFVAGMAPLADAAAELGDSKARDFDGADATLAFLRSRGLIAPDAAGLELVAQLGVDEDYLVAGRIRLGTLLDLVATFFDALDRLYDLAGNPAEGDEAAAARAPRMMGGAPAEPAAGNDTNRTLRA
jgi:hypothetical protein